MLLFPKGMNMLGLILFSKLFSTEVTSITVVLSMEKPSDLKNLDDHSPLNIFPKIISIKPSLN